MARLWVRRLAKFGGYAVLVLVALAAVALTFTVGWRPVIGAKKRPLTARKFEPTPQRKGRGEYLVRAVINCMGCHSKYDEKADPPVLLSQEGAGAVLYEDASIRLVAANITSDPETGLGRWSDDAIARAIREGIAANGTAMIPIMPYEHFRHLSDEDLASVVVFLRSLAPVQSDLPPSRVPFLIARLVQAAPRPVTEPVPQADLSTPARRGAYLAEMGHCTGCHTPMGPPPRFQPIEGMEMAGGSPMADGVSVANLTPDASGIVYYDEAMFIQAIRTGSVGARKLKHMPWWTFRNMTDEDLKAVFAYLRTLKPVHHRVDNTEPPTLCRLCRQKHGLGDQN